MRLRNNVVTSATPAVWFRIRELTRKLCYEGYDIVFMWVPAHKGIMLNEKADKAAKTASVEGDPVRGYLSSLDIKIPSKTRAMHVWQQKWDRGQKGRFCHDILPTVNMYPWFFNITVNRREIVILSKLISNHSRLPAHLFRNRILRSAACECGVNEATPNHVIFECSNYDEDQRQQMWIALRRRNIAPDVSTILKSKNIEVMKIMCNFIIQNNIDM